MAGATLTGPQKPLRRNTSRGSEVTLIGRTVELEQLRAVFGEVEQGETAAVIVTGDSGVGKTELVRAAMTHMRAADAVVLSGSCLDIGDVPLHPLRQALRRFEVEHGRPPTDAQAGPTANPVGRQAANSAANLVVSSGTNPVASGPRNPAAGPDTSPTSPDTSPTSPAASPVTNEATNAAANAATNAAASPVANAATSPAGIAASLRALTDGGPSEVDAGGALLERLAAGLSRLAEGRALVLFLDDLHWVDQTTSRLMRYLLAGLGGMRLLLVAAARVENLASAPSVRLMLSELSRLPSVRVLELRPLRRVESDELAAAIVGRQPRPAEAQQIWDRGRGNPFVVEALARGLRDGDEGVPETLIEIARARAHALPPAALQVARAVAVGMDPVDHALLARIVAADSVALDEQQLDAAVRTAVDQRILDAGEDGYRFHLGLVREAIESSLLPSERNRMHRRYAEALAAGAAGGEPQHGRLAHHWRLAGMPHLALDSAIRAAHMAERVYGYAEASAHWAFAMDVIESAPAVMAWPGAFDRTDVCRSAAEAAHRSGDHERALQLLQQAAASVAGPTPGWLRISRARYLTAVGRPADADAQYRQVLDTAVYPVRERAIAAAYSADLLLRHLGQYADAGQRAREALELAQGYEDLTSSIVLAGAALGLSQAYLNDPVAGRAAVAAAVLAAERSESPTDIARAHLYLAELLTNTLNELAEGVEQARHGAARATELGLGRTYGARLLAVAANGLFRLGEWSEAEHAVAEGFRHRPSGAEAVELLLARCRVYTGYGDLDAAQADLEAAGALTADGGAQHVLPLLILRAGLAMWRGEYVEARHAVSQGLGLFEGRSDDIVQQAVLVWHGLRAEAESRVSGQGADEQSVRGLRELAERLQDSSKSAAEPVRDAVEGFLALSNAETFRIAERPHPDSWAQAVRVWDSRGHVYPATYARLRQAEAMYHQRTRNADALVVLREAYRGARRLGARPLLAEVQQLALWARVVLEPPPPAAKAVPSPIRRVESRRKDPLAPLTDREREVLALVAQGLTNQDIGGQLFISPRTVGVHVSRTFAKLQVRSRVQASAIYQRRQLDSDL